MDFDGFLEAFKSGEEKAALERRLELAYSISDGGAGDRAAMAAFLMSYAEELLRAYHEWSSSAAGREALADSARESNAASSS